MKGYHNRKIDLNEIQNLAIIADNSVSNNPNVKTGEITKYINLILEVPV